MFSEGACRVFVCHLSFFSLNFLIYHVVHFLIDLTLTSGFICCDVCFYILASLVSGL